MHKVWSKLLIGGSRLMPDFNKFLLNEFRAKKMKGIVDYLNILFSESVKLFDGKMKFVGCEELTPDEYVEYLKTNQIMNRKIEIQIIFLLLLLKHLMFIS